MTWLVRPLPTGTVTFLFSDIEGSTRLLDELGPDRFDEALAEHRRVMREAFGAAGGVEVDTQGDAFFVAFPDARGALSAAAVAQERLAVGPVRVRIGIHSGEPLLTGEGYVGVDVHQGARVMSAGHGGQVLVSQATRALVAGDDLVPLGLHRLKDLTEPQPLYQLGEGEFPPLKALYQSNLPVQPTPLIGREAELAQVLALLRESRLVTFTGPGGSGKTRLALQAAAELVDEFEDGVWWVSLASLRDPELVEPTIAAVVGAQGGLNEHLSDKRALVLLDNFEQVLEGAPRIGELLRGAPDLSVLATSRERLSLAAEHEFSVPRMAPVEAVALFTGRARQLKPDFEPDEVVEEICRRLDGLPLAIELASARIKILHPEQILERLAHSLDLLTAGPVDAPERQRTLKATIEWSNDLLSDEERRLFACLAVFAGTFSLEAAESICDATLDELASLVDKSLLRAPEQGRFFMLETIREYAAERLQQSSGHADYERRHAFCFTAVAEEARKNLRGPSATALLEALDVDHDNLRLALTWAAANDDGILVRLVAALWRFWYVRGFFDEGRRWVDLAAERGCGQPPDLRGRVASGGTALAQRLGDSEAAMVYAEQAVPLFRQAGNLPWLAPALCEVAYLKNDRGETQEAERLYREAFELATESGDALSLSAVLNFFAYFLLDQGNFVNAIPLIERGVALARDLSDVEGIASGLADLSLALVSTGDVIGAVAAAHEALDLARALAHREMEATLLDLTAGVAVAQAEYAPALTFVGAADRIREEFGLLPARGPADARLQAEVMERLARHFDPASLGHGVEVGRSLEPSEALANAIEFLTP